MPTKIVEFAPRRAGDALVIRYNPDRGRPPVAKEPAMTTANANDPVVVDPADFDLSNAEGVSAYDAAIEGADTWIPRHSSRIVAVSRVRGDGTIALAGNITEELGVAEGDEVVFGRADDGSLVLAVAGDFISTLGDDALDAVVALTND